MKITVADRVALIRDKYNGDPDANLAHDEARLIQGEPLAYVIGWIPFFGLTIRLDSHPLIPRPETEWWTEQLVLHLKERFGDTPFKLLDLCAGSGAIGLTILKAFPNATVWMSEIRPEHVVQIQRNLAANQLNTERATILTSDIFLNFPKDAQFDVIAANPPYIPEKRVLDDSVMSYEPHDALFAGGDGMKFIKEILKEAPKHLTPGGELWMECDTSNIGKAKKFADSQKFETVIRLDQYERPRFIVASKTVS